MSPKTKMPIIALACLALTGCSSKPSIKDSPEQLAKLPQWTQVALVLETPLFVAAFALLIAAMNGPAVKIITKRKEPTP